MKTVDCKSVSTNNDITAFGFWLFLMSDAILFCLLFSTYGVMWDATAGGPAAKDVTGLGRPFLETLVLLTSSLSCGFISISMEQKLPPATVQRWLVITLILGVIFVALEIHEFNHLISEGSNPERSGFLSAFFVLVGTHGTHVTAGILWGTILMAQIATKGLTPKVTSRLTRFALYWHFLDIIWIGIFSFVYLGGQLDL